MNRRRATLVICGLLIVLFAVLVGGCGGQGGSASTSGREEKIRLSDGREIICIVYSGKNITCDWDHPVSVIDVPLEDEQ